MKLRMKKKIRDEFKENLLVNRCQSKNHRTRDDDDTSWMTL